MRPRFLLLLPLYLVVAADTPRHDHHGPKDALPHPHDPVLQAEHLAMLDLAKPADATHIVVKDGAWSDKAVWKNGKLPAAGANVLVPAGKTVTLDHVNAVALRTVRVDGKLRFAPGKDTALKVDTLVVAPEGCLEIGSTEHAIAGDKQARLIFADRGPIDTRWDPNLMSRGLIAHGTVVLHGARVTPFVALARAPERGDTKLVLAKKPTNWKKGDRLVLPGTSRREQDEELKILAIAGNEVTVRELAYDHDVPAEGLLVYLANLSRNVILESENTKDVERLGHVMFMHSPKVAIYYVGFHDLGRTDKRKPINDPRLDKDKKLISGTGQNPRGRYAVHFHRTGVDGHSPPALVQGSVVLGSPGWGFVNHSSNVRIEDNVAFRVAGAAFVTEAGDEIGSFRGNLAVRTIGSGENVIARQKLQDFAHEGDGFWFQGGGVAVEDNIAAGHNTGFIFFTQGLEEEGLGRRAFKIANLPDRSLVPSMKAVETKYRPKDNDCVSVQQVPVRSFKNNIVFASDVGIIVRFHLSPRHQGHSVLEGGAIWNTTVGVEILYTANVTLRNIRLVGNAREKTLNAIRGGNEGLGGLRYENLRVEGWPYGLIVPESGDNVIQGGYYNNANSIVIPTRLQKDRSVDIQGDIRFGTLSEEALGGRKQYDIVLQPHLSSFLAGGASYRDPNVLFLGDVIRYKDKQLYFREQAADFVPLKEKVAREDEKWLGRAVGSVPPELIGKSNRQLWDEYGIALGGAVAPADAVAEPRIQGFIGKPAKYAPPQQLWHPYQTNKRQGFKLVCTGSDKRKVAESKLVDLRPGWNVITLSVLGQRRSFLIYGGDIANTGKKYK
jgi:hypothetical protein